MSTWTNLEIGASITWAEDANTWAQETLTWEQTSTTTYTNLTKS